MQQGFIAMKITFLSALFLAGTVSLVSASPADKEATGRVSYTKAEPAQTATNEPWIELASPTPASHGKEFIEVDDSSGPLVRLRIAAHAGRPTVRSVRIDYKDGTQRTVRLDKTIDKMKPAYVDLRGERKIDRVIVVSEGSSKALYTVEAEPARSHVAAR